VSEIHCANFARSPSLPTPDVVLCCWAACGCPQTHTSGASPHTDAPRLLLLLYLLFSLCREELVAGNVDQTMDSPVHSSLDSFLEGPASPPSSPPLLPLPPSSLCHHPPRPFDKGPNPQLAMNVLGEGPTGSCRRHRTSSWPASDTRSSFPLLSPPPFTANHIALRPPPAHFRSPPSTNCNS